MCGLAQPPIYRMLSSAARHLCSSSNSMHRARTSTITARFRPSPLFQSTFFRSSSASHPGSNRIRHFLLASDELGKNEDVSSSLAVEESTLPMVNVPSRSTKEESLSSGFQTDVMIGTRRLSSVSRNVGEQPTKLKMPSSSSPLLKYFTRNYSLRVAKIQKTDFDYTSQRAVTIALWCNFLVFSLKFGVWFVTSSHVMLAEMVHSIADFANQALLAYGLSSSKRAPDALHPYGYSKERFVWSLISAVGIFCLGSGATIVHGVQNLWVSEPPENIHYAALVIGGSFLIEGASLLVAINAVKKGAAAEGMTIRDYVWRGHDPTSVAVMTEDSAAVTGLLIAAASLVAVKTTGNPIYDPIGSIIVGNLLGMVAIFLIQRNRHALIGRAIDDHDMQRVLEFLRSDPVVDSLYDCKSEVIGPGFFRFKAEIDFNGVVVVQNYLKRTGREEWSKKFRDAGNCEGDAALLKVMASYGEELVEALGSEVDRLEKEIQKIVPGIRHVDIEAHNPSGPSP